MKRPLIFLLLTITSLTMNAMLLDLDAMDPSDRRASLCSNDSFEQCLNHYLDKKNCLDDGICCCYYTAEFNFLGAFNTALCNQTQDNIKNLQTEVSNKDLSSEYIYKTMRKSMSEKDDPDNHKWIVFSAIAAIRPYLIYQASNKKLCKIKYVHAWICLNFIIPFVEVEDGSCKPWMEIFIDAINEGKHVNANINKVVFWLESGYNPHYQPILHNKPISLNLHDMIIQKMNVSNTRSTFLNRCNEILRKRNETERNDTKSMFYANSPFQYEKCGKPYEE